LAILKQQSPERFGAASLRLARPELLRGDEWINRADQK
jgi:hypothetical protein